MVLQAFPLGYFQGSAEEVYSTSFFIQIWLYFVCKIYQSVRWLQKSQVAFKISVMRTFCSIKARDMQIGYICFNFSKVLVQYSNLNVSTPLPRYNTGSHKHSKALRCCSEQRVKGAGPGQGQGV